MIIRESIKNKLPIIDYSNIYVLADFDKTITNGSSKTSWSILSESNLVPNEYKEERNALYEKYRPIEVNENLDYIERCNLVKEWYIKHIELFIKYKITKEIFEEAASNLRVMEFREGAKEFLKFLHDKNIPLIIISAGIGNFIECFLRHNNCYSDNIYISSNKIIFENNIATKVDSSIIHSLNKNEVSLPEDIKNRVLNRSKVLLLGDQIKDLNMAVNNEKKEIISIGFLTEENKEVGNFIENFDIVCEKDNYVDILSKIFDYKL